MDNWFKNGIGKGNEIAILLESFNKNSIDGAVTALLAELACGGL